MFRFFISRLNILSIILIFVRKIYINRPVEKAVYNFECNYNDKDNPEPLPDGTAQALKNCTLQRTLYCS